MGHLETNGTAASAEPAINLLVEELTARLSAGEAIDWPAVARAHPEHAAELSALRPALEALGRLSGAGDAAVSGVAAQADGLVTGVLGDFRIIREVGRGGMGVVYEAEQVSLSRRVALKVLPFAATMDPKQLQRFHNEAKAAASLHHDHIVPVHGVGCERGVHYYAMQFIDGSTLAQVITALNTPPTAGDATGPYQPAAPAAPTAPVAALSTERSGPKGQEFYRTVARLMAQAADALEHAHAVGIVHRDVKPGNLIVDAAGKLWVTDFGLARFGPDAGLTMSGDLLGTLRYMAPEQVLSHHGLVDHRADVYALGCTLYELLAGRPAVDAAERAEVLRRIAFEDPAPPRKLDKAIPAELETVTLKCLAKNPSERYATAGELADDLRRWLGHQTIKAKPPSLRQKAAKWVRRHRPVVLTAAGLLAMLAVTLVAATALSVWYALEADRARTQADGQRQLAEGNAEEAQRQTVEAERAKGDAQRAQQEAERQRNAVSQNLYVSDIRLGLVDWTAANLARLARNLAHHVPSAGRDDLRGWEWYYLLALCHQDERTLIDHWGDAMSVAWSPDGRYLASASFDGRTRVWDTASWRLLRTLHVGNKGVSWSPNSKRLAWGILGDDCMVRVWDSQSDEVKILKGHTSSVWATAWSPDGKHLASAGIDGTIRIWDPDAGSCLRVWKEGGNVNSLAWSPDGSRIASANATHLGGLKIRDAESGQILRDDLYPKFASCAAWSPDGGQLALATGAGMCVLYRTADWSQAGQWDGHSGGVNWVAWDPAGVRLASAGTDGLVRIWDPATGTCLFTFRGHVNQVNSLAWEPDGRRLASAGTDGTVKIWPLPPVSQPRRLDGRPGRVQAIAWGDEPNTLKSLDAAAGAITLWDVATGRQRGQTPVARGPVGQISPGGGLVAVATGDTPPRLVVCNARSGLPVQTVNALVPRLAAFSPDESQLAVAAGHALEIADLRRNEVRFRWDGTYNDAVSWSPDGRYLAVGGAGDQGDWTGWVHVFDTGTRQRVLKLRHGSMRMQATAVTWSPDGRRLVSGDGNGLAEVWEMPAGREVVDVQMHTAQITALAWSPDGRRVASGSADRTVRVWDPNRGEELLRFDISDAEVTQVQWSPDGRRLAAACADGTIQVWDASAGYQYLRSETYAREQARERSKEADKLSANGRRAEAIALLAETLVKQKSALGPDHDDTIETMAKLEHAYMTAGRLPEAIALGEELLERRKAKLGPDHDDTLTSMNNLAFLYFQAGRGAEALPLLERVVEEKRQAKAGPYDRVLPASMSNLADAYVWAGKFDRAELLLVDVLDGQRKAKNPAPQIAATLATLGLSRLKQHKYAEAEPVLRECLAIRTDKLPDDWSRFNAQSLLGGALLGQRKYAEAEPLLLQGYEGMKQREAKISPAGKKRLPEAVERIVALYEATSRRDEARAWRAKLPPAAWADRDP
jgi:WD40 repeat protein/serine/threonine protein kinase